MSKFFTPTKLSENIRETPEGFLLCMNVPMARTGWMDYGAGETPIEVGQGGVVKIYRDSSEVFRPETIASFEGKPVTIRHPEEFVNPKNWSYLAKGVVQNVRRGEKDEDGEESLVADILITDDFTINLVKAGLREVSCGYEAEYEEISKGKGRQTNIVGNHLALVEQGRAGSTYAINDEKGKVIMKKTIERLKLKFGAKVVDEAMAAEKETGDESGKSYDELVKMVKDLGEKIDGMAPKAKDEGGEEKKAPPKDDEKAKDEGEEKKAPPKEEKSKDDMEASEDEGEDKLESRLKALEAAVAKLLESQTGDESEEKEKDQSEDDDSDGDESEDEDGEEKAKKTGDEISRAEILSPGFKQAEGQDLKVEALKAAYQTKDGKEVIDSLTGGKKPAFDSKESVATLFIAASEVLKHKRGTGLEGTKNAKSYDSVEHKNEPMTAERMNEINASIWTRK